MTGSTDLSVWRQLVILVTLSASQFGIACSKTSEVSDATTRAQASGDEWVTYEGAWFAIEHPAHFDVSPSLRSDSADGFDSVFFNSRDASVSFYVLSPQWGRMATDIALQPETEAEFSVDTQFKGGQKKLTRVIRSRDGSYTREIDEYSEQDGAVNWVFEFRYQDDGTRQRYGPQYDRFKSSLQQLSD